MTFRLNNDDFKKLQNIVEWQIEVYLSKKSKELSDLQFMCRELSCKLMEIESALRTRGLL